MAIAHKLRNRRGEGLALEHLGYAQFRSGNLIAAEQSLRKAVQVWESLRARLSDSGINRIDAHQIDANKVSLFETQVGTYRTLQQVLVSQKKTDTALEIAERGRARAFAELLEKRLATKGSNSESHKEEPQSLQISPPNLEQIRQVAKAQDAVLIEYSVIYNSIQIDGKAESAESTVYIWVIQPTGEITFRQVDLQPWTNQLPKSPEVPSLLTFRAEPDEIPKQLKQFHQLLIQPIADLLPTNSQQRIIFMPQGPLFLTPFAALQDKNGQYLVEKHTILTAPSIQVLEQTRQLRARGKGQGTVDETQKPSSPDAVRPPFALIVGNPVPMPSPLPPLPDAELEAKSIAKLFNVSPLINQQATKTEILQRMPAARWIHFATHGLFDSNQGLKSAIALAPNAGDNGFLTAEQILDLKLNAELVVLSACNTGRGKITGDGIIGLSRSLITAGVPSVMVSLWAIPDSPTSFLMTEFYRNLKETPDKAQALRLAMLTTMQQHPSPLDWAGFTLIGEAK